jgi:hypothetical protein
MESISLMSDYHAQHASNSDSKATANTDDSAEFEMNGAVDEDTVKKEEKRFLRRLDWILMCVVFLPWGRWEQKC